MRWSQPQVFPSQVAYALWAKSYPPRAHNAFMRLEQETLSAWLPARMDGLQALDLACGTGRWGALLAQRGAQVISLDNSRPMLQAGVARQPIESEMSALPLASARFDWVLCGLAVGHLTRPLLWATLAEIARVLRGGGRALLSDLHPFQAWNGAQRTFRHKRRTYAVEHYIHSYAVYHQACQRLGLYIHAVAEKSLHAQTPPILLALHLQKVL
jgi:malonyl-CoA O-methyltransferase